MVDGRCHIIYYHFCYHQINTTMNSISAIAGLGVPLIPKAASYYIPSKATVSTDNNSSEPGGNESDTKTSSSVATTIVCLLTAAAGELQSCFHPA
jgi:hypothetical protein